ncbi:probable serine/threonine-protein kinase At1g54610 [Juglans microcarpa x Juglans regia]|uniref:probable serine/threonine-protein kinase At1g54610 n=1 Tax=Juglans microcarpa x Juglans regia TaxID=2249226 RepID=UPI001B7E9910|nr:probable serine/threonine-protein kinase At1g54610 [Juglans microcarpa x Juglans regia]
MGCVQAKAPESSESRGLGKFKQENGYVGRGGFADHRRSTGQRDMHRGSGKEYNRAESRKQHVSYGNKNGGVGDVGGEGKLIGRERDGDGGGNGGSMSQRISWLKPIEEIELVDGWPKWLTDNIPRQVLTGFVPRSADSYVMLTKVGQGTYSNVYKARDRDTNKIVALKKVRFDTSEPESVKFMAREIMILQQLDHPNIIKLEGLATSRLLYSLYLVFDFMQTDLATIISRPEGKLTEAQVKCYMHQLLSGLQHCHDKGILHRDIKGANLLIDKNGMLKIADFGLANYYTRNRRLTNRVVTLWYRAPELLLGATDYGVGIDLWSAGCLFAEMFSGSPIMPARTEVEQLHRIFKLCGTPSDEYWKKLKLSSKFRIPQFRPSLTETFSEFPASSLGLLNTLLALDPAYRGCASLALQNEFFYTSPLACALSDLPVIHSKDDELKEANEERKYRNSRMKHQSRTVRERRRKDLANDKPKEDKEYPPKEQEKIAEPDVQFQEPDSTTSSASSGVKPASRTESPTLTTSSTSSGVKLSSQTASPYFSLSPDVSFNPRMLLNTHHEVHPNSSKNTRNLPPLPTSAVKDNDMFRFKRVHRSASTRDFRKTGLGNHFDHVYAIDD